jgi:hypothetical protein
MKHQRTEASRIAAGIITMALAGQARATLVSQMDIQVSRDGLNWSTSLTAFSGETIQFRTAITFRGDGTTATPVGLASLNFQPVIRNVDSTDSLAAFANRGNNTNGGSVTYTAGTGVPFGRISPFGATGPTTTDPYVAHRQIVSGINYLRIARNTITNWVGIGVSTGTGAANNFNGAGGLAIAQKAEAFRSSSDPLFNNSITGVILFKAGIQVGSSPSVRTLVIDAPLESMRRDSTTGARFAAWFESTTDAYGRIHADMAVNQASIFVLPAPGSCALVAASGLLAARRRRS